MVQVNSLLVAGALFSVRTFAATNPTIAASAFVTNDTTVAFALNIPSDSENELYFSLSGSSSSSYISVGMGSNTMANSLMFLAYASSDGKNVTLSPRLSTGHKEPSYTSNVTFDILDGTGISNNIMTVNARCQNCRSWGASSIDIQSTVQSFIFASGSKDRLTSDSMTASIQRHATYGVVQMDLTKAVGTAGVPNAPSANSAGTVEIQDKKDSNIMTPVHGALMIFTFVGLMPLGVLILRIMNSPKWHAINQTVSAAVALIGALLGVFIGFSYNRSKNMITAHQIFGLVITVAMIAQFVLGFMHHRIYKKTLATTKLAPWHVWIGRLVIPAGVANLFLGFPLALNPRYNLPMIGVVLFALIVMLGFIIWKRRNFRRADKRATSSDNYESGRSHISRSLDLTARFSSQIQLRPMPLPSGHGYQNA